MSEGSATNATSPPTRGDLRWEKEGVVVDDGDYEEFWYVFSQLATLACVANSQYWESLSEDQKKRARSDISSFVQSLKMIMKEGEE